ncbi:hypothetical protein THTE_0504 [Thermogutta terrifontis]|uniref:Uncharacterized protein n=1 Tax=Thermogutta terrifontis TaxID=1331910 RepID=A0A286RAW7_9BACT|nr:hypothetical protein THTE_0504 [Thermogutta terrifontis]
MTPGTTSVPLRFSEGPARQVRLLAPDDPFRLTGQRERDPAGVVSVRPSGLFASFA